MGGESRTAGAVPASEQVFPGVHPNFAVVARALWPTKTAAHLAHRARVTERAAKYWLSGDRAPSAAAIAAVIAAMLE